METQNMVRTCVGKHVFLCVGLPSIPSKIPISLHTFTPISELPFSISVMGTILYNCVFEMRSVPDYDMFFF